MAGPSQPFLVRALEKASVFETTGTEAFPKRIGKAVASEIAHLAIAITGIFITVISAAISGIRVPFYVIGSDRFSELTHYVRVSFGATKVAFAKMIFSSKTPSTSVVLEKPEKEIKNPHFFQRKWKTIVGLTSLAVAASFAYRYFSANISDEINPFAVSLRDVACQPSLLNRTNFTSSSSVPSFLNLPMCDIAERPPEISSGLGDAVTIVANTTLAETRSFLNLDFSTLSLSGIKSVFLVLAGVCEIINILGQHRQGRPITSIAGGY